MLTVIPDIHADATRLRASLAMVASSRIGFLGDFIDAGQTAPHCPDDLGVLQQVRALIDAGKAVAVMGNHELNAILFHRRGDNGAPLRDHSAKNCGQHASFIAAFGTETPDALAWTEWFLAALPLWHEEEGLRLVHACWSDPEIALIRARRPDGRLKPEDLPEIARESSDFGRAVKLITSGREVRLPDGAKFHDYDGIPRKEVRLKWWGQADTWRGAALSVPDPAVLPDGPLPPEAVVPPYPEGAPPVLVGHYKLTGPLALGDARVSCLDYPQIPCLYRWQGEARLRPDHLHHVPLSAARPNLGMSADGLSSNGYGSHICSIVFSTDRQDADTVSNVMQIEPQFRATDPEPAWFTWHPTSTRRGDDESIVFMLGLHLSRHCRWQIDWASSKY